MKTSEVAKMKNGFIKVCAATSDVSLLKTRDNISSIKNKINDALEQKSNVIVFQELNITGYSLQDFFIQDQVLKDSLDGLIEIANFSKNKDIFIVVGLPFKHLNKVYIVDAAILNGKILGIVPKTFLPNYNEFYDARYFAAAPNTNSFSYVNNMKIPFGNRLLFRCSNIPELVIGIEICEDLWAPVSISTHHALAGATVILNSSASNEIVGKDVYREELVKSTSSRLISAYIYSCAGKGESTTDVVYSGHNMIYENGHKFASVNDFKNHSIYSIIDVKKLSYRRSKMTTFINSDFNDKYKIINFEFTNLFLHNIKDYFHINPFISSSKVTFENSLKKILSLQENGLIQRISHLKLKNVVIGISGGLDSTLALLTTYKTFRDNNMDVKGIHAFSLPAFATTNRTKNNAEKLCNLLNVSFEEIDISDSVRHHLKDLNHPLDLYDIAFENAQARERTQVLMDKANMLNAVVLGTGDLSELALGWATFNGDHMSMYNLNAGIPKTIVKEIVNFAAEHNYFSIDELCPILKDITNTPISPELVPGNGDIITQVTEDFLGPYAIHDFLIYHILRSGFDAEKLRYCAKQVFENLYSQIIIEETVTRFLKKFINSQFKRSSMPDSIKVGSISLSPRGDLKLPSDLNTDDYLK